MKKFLLVALCSAATCMMAADGAKTFNQCKACHGQKADVKYLNKVPPLATLKPEDMVTAMEGYKAGTNNKYKTGVLMKAQMAKLTKEDMEAVANYISTTFGKK